MSSTTSKKEKIILDGAKKKAEEIVVSELRERGWTLKNARQNEALWAEAQQHYRNLTQAIVNESKDVKSRTSMEVTQGLFVLRYALDKDLKWKTLEKRKIDKSKKEAISTNNTSTTKPFKLPDGIETKEGVKIDNLAPSLQAILPNIVKAFENSKTGFKPLISSGNDSNHSKGSKHYTNEAIDLSSWSADYSKKMNQEEIKKIAETITGSSLKSTPVNGDQGRLQSDWDSDGDGKRDFILIVEHPGVEGKQHIHIQVAD
jgi:hypothetical protein